MKIKETKTVYAMGIERGHSKHERVIEVSSGYIPTVNQEEVPDDTPIHDWEEVTEEEN